MGQGLKGAKKGASPEPSTELPTTSSGLTTGQDGDTAIRPSTFRHFDKLNAGRLKAGKAQGTAMGSEPQWGQSNFPCFFQNTWKIGWHHLPPF